MAYCYLPPAPTWHGYEVWRSDGTAAGTRLVADIAATAVRSAISHRPRKRRVDRADESLDVIRQQHADLQRQFEADTAALERSPDVSTINFRSVQLTPRKSDIAVGEVAMVWAPWRTGADGFPAPAYD